MAEYYCSICNYWIISKNPHFVSYYVLAKEDMIDKRHHVYPVCNDCYYKLSLFKEANDFNGKTSYNVMKRIMEEPKGILFLSWAASEAWEKLMHRSSDEK